MDNLKILITGASSEIGIAIAEKFNKAGNALFLHCFQNKQRLLDKTEKFEAEVHVLTADFSNEIQVNDFISSLRDITIIVNAAAYIKADLLVNITDADIQKMFQVNVSAPVKICRAVIPQMLVKHKGTIINISSIAASRGNRGQTVYGGTKGFLESFSRSLAAEYGMKGIRVNCVAPGAIDAGSIKDLMQMAPEEVKQSIALNYTGSSNDVASLVYFLCSKEASFINGQTVHVDGGFMRGV